MENEWKGAERARIIIDRWLRLQLAETLPPPGPESEDEGQIPVSFGKTRDLISAEAAWDEGVLAQDFRSMAPKDRIKVTTDFVKIALSKPDTSPAAEEPDPSLEEILRRLVHPEP